MSFDSLGDFLGMGGHALYVWLAYGSALVVIVGNLWAPVRARRRFFTIEVQRARRSTSGVNHAPPSS